LDADGRITPDGKRLRQLPLPPRLARMVMKAAEHGAARDAADIAALLVERGLGGNDTSLEVRLDNFRRDRGRRAGDMRRMAEGWAASAKRGAGAIAAADGTFTAAQLLTLGYPDRIAKARGAPGQFLLASGRGAVLDATDALARAPYLAVAEMQGKASATRILLAAAATEADILAIAKDRIVERDELSFDDQARAVRARRVRRLDGIELASEQLRVAPGPDTEAALADGIGRLGVGKLPWSKSQIQLRERSGFLRAALGSEWPDLTDETLGTTVREWLLPFLSGKTRLADVSADDLGQALDALIPWSLKRRLEDEAPTHFEAPTGNRHAIDYDGAGAPALHVRVQELFGLKSHPSIAGGKLPLTLHLLSPAHRPVQITRDLPGFWAGSWAAVKADMKGRYPRHFWPDDPANAAPTARAKPRGT
jgi:ATP-dependent helicase HrpB